ncbi:hypothetical protein OA085_00875 [Alphaproteobacteria bacterium]|nr:hypothetical protein [Alphaproteobacteria bacterium]
MTKIKWFSGIFSIVLFSFSMPMSAIAEGRTYVSKKDSEVKYQICRLSKTERTATSTSCYYKAQKPEDNLVVSTESPKTVCQREFTCKVN